MRSPSVRCLRRKATKDALRLPSWRAEEETASLRLGLDIALDLEASDGGGPSSVRRKNPQPETAKAKAEEVELAVRSPQPSSANDYGGQAKN